DGHESAYLTGDTASTNFPTAGALQGTNHGNADILVAKLNASGELVYATYLGGSSRDSAKGIAVDSAGNVSITGDTSSTDFPTAGAASQTTNHGGSDAFVANLNPPGNGLVYATYLVGSGNDFAAGIALARAARVNV